MHYALKHENDEVRTVFFRRLDWNSPRQFVVSFLELLVFVFALCCGLWCSEACNLQTSLALPFQIHCHTSHMLRFLASWASSSVMMTPTQHCVPQCLLRPMFFSLFWALQPNKIVWQQQKRRCTEDRPAEPFYFLPLLSQRAQHACKQSTGIETLTFYATWNSATCTLIPWFYEPENILQKLKGKCQKIPCCHFCRIEVPSPVPCTVVENRLGDTVYILHSEDALVKKT